MGKSVKENRTTQNSDRPVRLTKKLMNEYRESLINRGCKQQTISMYFCYLNRLYSYLKGNKELTDKNLERWIAHLKDEGYSDRTINLHISSVNGLLRFSGKAKMPISVISIPQSAGLSELTREEYLKLLSYVKSKGSQRDYLLIKTMATIDINVTDLPLLTIEACKQGYIEYPNYHQIFIPDGLRQELLSYAEGKGRSDGPVFMTNRGNQPDRSNITHSIEQYGREAGIDAVKCNPRALHHLYERTQEQITQRMTDLRIQEYEKLLNDEDEKVG